MAVLPMFPLGSVVLPGTMLSLHVFEPRYRSLVHDCVANEPHEFGVVLIDRGSEVGGGDVRRAVGTVTRMVHVAQTPDGRYAVVAGGVRRIRVVSWLADDPYPQADIEEWPDDPDWPDDSSGDKLLATVLQKARRTAAFALELGDAVTDPSSEISDETLLASYQLANLAPLGDADRYTLLSAPGPHARLLMLDEMLDEVAAVLDFRLRRA